MISGTWTDGSSARILALTPNPDSADQQKVQDNKTKSKILHSAFFPNPSDTEDATILDNYNYPEEAFPVQLITNKHIQCAINELQPYKAPGPNGIPNIVIKQSTTALMPYLGILFRATFELEVYPDSWRQSSIIVLQKPGRPNYTLAKAYRPIALMDTLGKTLSLCVADILTHQAETLQLLPNTHFGGQPGQTTTDALQLMACFIKNKWRRGNIVSVLFLDFKAVFPSVSVK